MSIAGQQSPAMCGLLAAAGTGGFAVPHCRSCGHRFYPAQSWCPQCLSDAVGYLPDSGLATVISMTELRISFDARFKSQLPVHVACARTASGVSLFALADAPLAAGATVQVYLGMATDDSPALLRVRGS